MASDPDRLTEVEIKMAFLEHHVAELDELLRRSIARVEELEREVGQVRAQLDVASETGTLRDEKPPHH